MRKNIVVGKKFEVSIPEKIMNEAGIKKGDRLKFTAMDHLGPNDRYAKKVVMLSKY